MVASVVNNSRNVYIVGAGLSAEARLPLISDFMNALRDAQPWLESYGRASEAAAIKRVLEFRLDAAAAAYRVRLDLDNIEQLFSLADAVDTGYELEKDIRIAIASTLDFLAIRYKRDRLLVAVDDVPRRNRFALPKPVEAPTTAESNRDYRLATRLDLVVGALIGAFSDADNLLDNSFITFNYDTLVETALNNWGVPFHYGFQKRAVNFEKELCERESSNLRAVPVLKLHGSVNWAYPGVQGKKLTIYGHYEQVRASNLAPRLFPPTWQKPVTELADIWQAAIGEIQAATRIFVIGYSMPESDLHFKYLLAAGLKKNVSLRQIVFVSPTAELYKDRLINLFGSDSLDRNVVKYETLTAFDFARTKFNPHVIQRQGHLAPTMYGSAEHHAFAAS